MSRWKPTSIVVSLLADLSAADRVREELVEDDLDGSSHQVRDSVSRGEALELLGHATRPASEPATDNESCTGSCIAPTCDYVS